ncbi:hypothetical protein L1887_62810 [Cichorium endivia]|nr:hypothetical protein L1887_62810 [Cichorium endivia]
MRPSNSARNHSPYPPQRSAGVAKKPISHTSARASQRRHVTRSMGNGSGSRTNGRTPLAFVKSKSAASRKPAKKAKASKQRPNDLQLRPRAQFQGRGADKRASVPAECFRLRGASASRRLGTGKQKSTGAERKRAVGRRRFPLAGFASAALRRASQMEGR